MNTNIKIDDSLLADYILGLLQPDVEAHIWSELQKDPNLMLRYQGLKGIKLMHPDRDPEEVLDEKVAELQAFAQNLIAKKKTASQNHLAIEKVETQNPIAAKKEAIPKVFLLNKYFRAAIIIGVVTCLSIVTYQLMQPQKQSPGNLAALSPTQIIKNKEAEINWTDDNVRGEMDDETAKWQDAANHSNFQLAINLLQNKQNRTPAEQFYLGFFYLKLNQFLMAEAALNKVPTSGNLYSTEAIFFLASAQYYQHKKQQAKLTLEKIKSNYPKADELLESIYKE